MAATIATIGYEGATIDAFVQTLRENKIQCLIDVRRNALSRKPGFSKKALTAALAGSGIRYVHLPEAGIASQDRNEADSEPKLASLLKDYGDRISARTELLEAVRTETRTYRCVLMCFEADTDLCHRGQLAKAVEAAHGVPVRHLDARISAG